VAGAQRGEINYRVDVADDPLGGTVRFVSESVREVLGYAPDDFYADPSLWFSLIHPDDLPLLRESTPSITDGSLPGVRCYRMRHRLTEKVVWIDDTVVPQFGAKGQIVSMQGLARDVTARHHDDERLGWFMAAVEQMEEPVFITDRAGTTVYANPAFESMSGYSQAELVGSTPSILKSGEHPPAFYRSLWSTILAGEVFRGVLINRKKSGEIYYIDKVISPIRDASGTVKHFVSTGHDITKQVRAEREMRLLLSVTNKIEGAAPDWNAAVGAVLREICEATGWDYGEAWTPNPDGSRLVVNPEWYASSPEVNEFGAWTQGTTFASGEGLPGLVWKSGKAEWHQDVSTLPRTRFRRAGAAIDIGLKAGFGVPINARGRTIAVLCFYLREQRLEDAHDVEIVTAVASQLSPLLLRCEAERELQDAEAR
jgi:PAS domain S-box-containing protein